MKNLPVLHQSSTTAQDCLVYIQRQNCHRKGRCFHLFSHTLCIFQSMQFMEGKTYDLYNNTELFNIHIIILLSHSSKHPSYFVLTPTSFSMTESQNTAAGKIKPIM